MLTTALNWIQNNPQWIAIFLYSLLECYLGKSKKVESSSVIELVFNGLKLLWPKKKSIDEKN